MKRFALPDRRVARRLFQRLAERPPAVEPCRTDKPLVLYGAGNLGALAADMLGRLALPVAYAMDRAPSGDRLLAGRIPVLEPRQPSPEERGGHTVAVCVVNAPYRPIRDALAEMGWGHICPVYDLLEAYADRMPIKNGWFAGPLSERDVAGIEAVLARWEDDRSRAAHLQFLAWRLHRREWCFADAPVRIGDRYFIGPIREALRPDECFLDGGAHRGAVIERWLETAGGAFRAALAVEPDRENARCLRERIARLPAGVARRIRVMECALAARGGSQPFRHGFDLASRLEPGAADSVAAHRLDDLDFPVSFGKIHLEGGERAALEGGMETLRRFRPLLAVTLYHDRDGLWRTAALLMELLPDYRFLLRLHAWCGTGVVLYAIPAERWVGSSAAGNR